MLLWNLLKHKRLMILISKYHVNLSTQHSSKNAEKICEFSYKVFPNFGRIYLNSHCNCIIRPSDPQLYPDADHAKIIHWGIKGKQGSILSAELLEKKNFLKIEMLPSNDQSHCEIFIPMKYDIEAIMQNGANLQVENVESDKIDVTASQGSLTTKNIKTEELSFTVDDGVAVLSGAFQGNLSLNAKTLTLKAQRLQGTLLCVQADHLSTEIESSYMNKGSIFARTGNLYIKNLHGSTDLHVFNGNLHINGLHGSVQSVVNEGNVDIHVSRITANSLVQIEKGSLQLSFSDLSNKSVAVSAPSLEISPEVEAFGSTHEKNEIYSFSTSSQTEPVLHANVVSGDIKLFMKDWFSSLGIKTSN